MFATAPATTRPARSSRGKEMMRTTRPPVVDGLSLALQAASSDTSTSTTARIQASYAIVTDFFNGLLGGLSIPGSGWPKANQRKSRRAQNYRSRYFFLWRLEAKSSHAFLLPITRLLSNPVGEPRAISRAVI